MLWRKKMFLTSRLIRIGRLAIAPIKGFFSLKTETKMPDFEPGRGTWWAYIKEVARRDTILYFEPFTNAIRCFREARAKA
jgi:hypothetical protein